MTDGPVEIRAQVEVTGRNYGQLVDALTDDATQLLGSDDVDAYLRLEDVRRHRQSATDENFWTGTGIIVYPGRQ